MKKHSPLFLIFFLTLSLSAAAQFDVDIRQALREDPTNASTNSRCYEFFPEAGTTPAPDGFKPVYISQYARHGSRTDFSAGNSENLTRKLDQAIAAGIALTERGQILYEEAKAITKLTTGNEGGLLPAGQAEHAAIARRLCDRYGVVFEDGIQTGKAVRLKSTTSPRVLLSMAAFTNALSDRYPDIKFAMTTKSDGLSNGPDDYVKGEVDVWVKEIRSREMDYSYLFEELFTDPAKAQEILRGKDLESNIFHCARFSKAFGREQDIYSLLSEESLYKWWLSCSTALYFYNGNSVEFGARRMPGCQELVDIILNDAEEALAGDEISADLIFGHDYPIVALASRFHLEGIGESLSRENFEQRWTDPTNISFASNLQMVYYRNQAGNVLVKFIYNDRERHVIGLEAVNGIYYRWEDIKALRNYVPEETPAQEIKISKTSETISPDGRVKAIIESGNMLRYSVVVDGERVLGPSEIEMELCDGRIYGGSVKLKKTKSIRGEKYNESTLNFGDFELIVRAYDDGTAYRFVSHSKNAFKVRSEKAEAVLGDYERLWVNYVNSDKYTFQPQYNSAHENVYDSLSCENWSNWRLAISPLAIEMRNGLKLTLGEADLMNYPGMYYNIPDGKPALRSHFPPVPETLATEGTSKTVGIIRRVKETEDYIAECQPGEVFPWRYVSVARNAAEMMCADMTWRLATPAADVDWSWVKPGKCAWDWWTANNLEGVDFEAGFNTATYKYYIDFAARNGLEYIVMDGGWSVRSAADLMAVVPEIDLRELVEYGASKNVGIILWAGYWTFHKDMDNVCRHYSEMGIKGFKVDFQDRDDQPMIAYYKEAAETCAKYHLLLDLHGCSKPTGLQRTYPNLLSFEAVFGMEQAKFECSESLDMVTNELVIPFVRMQAGPLDYTSGAMHNAAKGCFRAICNAPMSQGTRARQIAQFVLFETPLPMLCDSPSNYEKESDCLDFIKGIPCVWDETVALDGKIGEYAAIARRKGNEWYVAAIGNWDGSDRTLDLSFLPDGEWFVDAICDGTNAARNANDYTRRRYSLEGRELNVHLAPGGGFVAHIRK